MKLTIIIDTENDAFQQSCASEVARILRDYSERITQWGVVSDTRIRDINGNLVGKATFR